MTAAEEKSICRVSALSRRDALRSALRAQYSLAICRALESLDELRTARSVLCYAPVGSECDLSPLYSTLRARGVTLAFPVTEAGGRMEAYAARGALRRGRFGVPEPDPAEAVWIAPQDLDAVLVPCVAFDGDGNRLGHGGGYFDRYLARCPQAAAILTAFEAQRLSRVPCEAHDRGFSVLVTEKGVFRK